MVAAVPANSSSSIDPAAIASALGVTTLDITKLNTMTDVHNCDPMPGYILLDLNPLFPAPQHGPKMSKRSSWQT
ncbi:hypothetical protein HRS9122_08416 [Pyrenophora teres f. teres]|nr:hypothetical protein HRS9122_08416 [Pyrenophora teres f. teres]